MICPREKIFAIRRDDLTYNLIIVIIQAALKDVKKRWKIRNEFTIVCEYRNIERKKKKGTFRRHRSSIYSSLVKTRERCEKGGRFSLRGRECTKKWLIYHRYIDRDAISTTWKLIPSQLWQVAQYAHDAEKWSYR